MPLKISLKPDEKIIVNGAVLQAVSQSVSLMILNEASIMREKDIISDDSASTPARRVYHALQCAYLFPARRREHLATFRELLDELVEAVPRIASVGSDINREIERGRFYRALRSARTLIEKEQEIFDAYTHCTV